ncbi:MAG: PDZ domain-containing protein [Bdellovibrionales bacterium]|nr:PDZ domain-containing protein [Bdellovibrionales bacterium]
MAILGRTSRMMSQFRGSGFRPPFESSYIYLFILFLGYLISDLSILNLRPAMLPTKAPPLQSLTTHGEKISNRSSYTVVSDRNLFNADGVIPPTLASQQQENKVDESSAPVLSQLPLKLEGTIVHLNPERSVATITIQAKNETKSFIIEDEVAGLARIVKIERQKVIFRNLNNNRLEYIEIPKEMTLSFGVKTEANPNEEVVKSGEFDFSMRREDLNKYTANLSSILNQARMVPNIAPGSGGRIDGFRFISMQPNSIYEKLGFKPGDVIKSVNGEPVNSPAKAMEMYNALRSDARIQIGVERGGRDETFNYEVK